ncbi:MAG TPA: ATP-dependent endonuclease, partial [Oligoflexia bacterium]|nr:ATP-dependent endonuclease [Oligoflexia bacterium]
RYFETVLSRLAQSGNQVLLTTHSPVFVKIHQPESVALIRRTRELGTWACHPKIMDLSDTQRQTLRLLTEFHTERKELFFAKGVVLVEGGTEKVSLPLIFSALDEDINRLGISVVEVGGKTKFPLFVRVLNGLKIPHVVIADHDIREIDTEWSDKRKEKERKRNNDHQRWNADIEAVCQPSALFWLKPDFESELGLPHEESEKIDKALALFSTATRETIPQCLLAPISALLEKVKQC